MIVNPVEELRTSNGLSAAVAGAAIQRMFALHLDKENRLLMPFIVSSPSMSLAQLVQDAGSHHH
ncbi:hypothetical protein [Pseudarthrobacter sp. NamB4]|uniref:hypothetical protein n=1 Tax=Pseudarthrobacter sp. NamB4 TaxID=2576837 RepID=UPI001F0D3A22|nr:hypothetical protein [Pseudarthrobacter sp. NamB4]